MPIPFRQTRLPAGLLVAALLLFAADAGAVGRVDRKGVYTLGGWFQYGIIEGESRYGLDFSHGPGYSIHFRYNTTRRTALAVYFENQTYSAKDGAFLRVPGAVDTLLDDLKLTNVHAGIRFFNSPQGDVLRYAEITAGFYRPELRLMKTQQQSSGEDIVFPGEGFLLHAGLGAEIFITPSWAVEFGAHGYALTGRGLGPQEPSNGEKNLSVCGQVAVGFDYFLLR